MPDEIRPQLGRLLTVPLATIGVLAAVLLWELEHIGSPPVTAALLGGAVIVALVVTRRVHQHIGHLSSYYESLLQRADEESRRAEAASRLKDEFLATLSHELRTPLNSVLGWARLLSTGKLDEPQARRALQAIERAGWAQSRTIEDLLELSRIVNGTVRISPRPILVGPVMTHVVEALRPAADAKQLTLVAEVDPALGPIVLDPDRIRQILWNLTSNAIKFTPTGGRVAVSVAARGADVEIAVTDTGIGFTAETAAHLFERFRQGDSSPTREYGGLGLGLGIVRHLAELHGGTVSAESPGERRGATFRVRLPMQRAPEPAPLRPPRIDGTAALQGVSVLVVDDDPQVLQFAHAALEPHGATVRTAGSAREAREVFTHAPADVIVADLVMPGEDGLELMRCIRALPPEHGGRTPAAALTGLARTEDRRRALAAGYDMHLAKPIDPEELAAAVEQLVEGHVRA